MSRAHSDPYSNADAQKSWNLLEDAIAKIYEKKSFELSYEELYRHAYYLVLHRHGDLTFQNLQKSMRSHLKRYQYRLLQAQENEFLSQFNEIWIEAKEMVKGIAQIFLYMDRSYVVSKSLSPLKILGYQIFLQVFLEDQTFCDKFQQEVFDLIRQERDGLRIDRILLKNLLGMLIELGTRAHYTENMSSRPYGASALVGHYNHHNPAKNTCTLTITKDIYIRYFEKDFLKETEAYYHEEAQRNISNMTAIEYLNKTERRCKEELERVELYLDISTKKPLIDVFMSTYIVKHSRNISDMDGLYTLFDGEKVDEIKRLYKMFLFNEASTTLFLNAFLDYQKKNLEKIMSRFTEEETDYLTLVNNLVEFYRKITRISKSMYEKEHEKNVVISKIIKDAFEQHINSNSKIPFALNFFLDQQFKEGFKGLKDSEIEAILNDVIALFKFINDKDVFEKTYKTFLSKRLLTGRSVSEENERLLIEKLQQECGSYFTAKIEVMFKDISLSKMIMSEFHSKCHTMPFAYQNTGIENLEAIKAFEVQVLTTGNWPFQDNDQCNLPAELKMWTKLFEGFYINKYPGRGLKWMLSQGTAEVKGHFNGKKKEFIMTTYQMCILLLFNSKKAIKVDEIASQTMIPEEDIYNNIAAFISLKLMSKNSEGLEVNGDDVVTLNEDFTHKNYRIKVPSKKKKEKSQDGEKKVLENVTIERKYSVEASIVRIMKSRKRLEHGNLVEEVMKLSTLHQFKPDAALIKKVIEELITKEYIDRAPENRNMYIYLS